MIFWRFRKRYGLKEFYRDYHELKYDARKKYKWSRGEALHHFHSRSTYHNTVIHIDPRGNCGAYGKVLCYVENNRGVFYCGKHKKRYPKGWNCRLDNFDKDACFKENKR